MYFGRVSGDCGEGEAYKLEGGVPGERYVDRTRWETNCAEAEKEPKYHHGDHQ